MLIILFFILYVKIYIIIFLRLYDVIKKMEQDIL
jgi:hypothetical protein